MSTLLSALHCALTAPQIMLAAIATSRKAMMLGAMADARGAVEAYRKVLAIDERLLAQRPADTGYLSDAAVANRNLAKALVRIHETAEAGKLAERSMQLYQQIASADPNNFRIADRSRLRLRHYRPGSGAGAAIPSGHRQF